MNNPAILLPPDSAMPSLGQNVVLFRIYLVYRALLSILLLLMLLLPATRQLVGSANPTLYNIVALAFLSSNILLLSLIHI
mgnify:FL=1